MVKTPCVAVFGGSGKTGRELIAVALKKGVLVRALYRPGSEPSQTPGLEIITGQLTEPGDIRRTLEGADGAILVFGPRLGRHAHPEPFCAGATSRIIAEMKRLGGRTDLAEFLIDECLMGSFHKQAVYIVN